MDALLTLKVKGRLEVLVHDARTGRLISRQQVRNLIVDAGLNLLRGALAGSAATLSHIAVGTGTTAAAASDTALATEVYRGGITKRTNGAAGVVTLDLYLSSASANGSDLTEAGILTAATAGTLFARTVHAPITKTATITVTYRWTLTLGAE